jgi:DNA-binding NarL/FixJ family response regulator
VDNWIERGHRLTDLGETMNTTIETTAPISGLMSLVSSALASAPAGQAPWSDPRETPAPELAALLGQVAGGWAAVKEDGQGWMLLYFAPDAQPAPPERPRTVPSERARRVHTALTEREREVLCLVAGGATNRAIAARLFISEKTASVHVSHILTKLDAATRTEAAALAHASGLVQTWDTDVRAAG